jgi:hypothetical protein
MMHGLPLLVLVFAVALTVMAFWRLVLMIFVAATLTLLALGLIDAITWVGDLR